MSMVLRWQDYVKGEQIRQRISLLGQGFALTIVDDVIVDCNWLISSSDSLQNNSEWAQKIERSLLNSENDVIELKLLERGTVYSRTVWKVLTEIPSGQVSTYSELAEKLNSGPRAVAQACRNNPYPGIIPCHRVVSKSGIGGFMGQTQGPWVEFKRQLLTYERKFAFSGK